MLRHYHGTRGGAGPTDIRPHPTRYLLMYLSRRLSFGGLTQMPNLSRGNHVQSTGRPGLEALGEPANARVASALSNGSTKSCSTQLVLISCLNEPESVCP